MMLLFIVQSTLSVLHPVVDSLRLTADPVTYKLIFVTPFDRLSSIFQFLFLIIYRGNIIFFMFYAQFCVF